MSTQDPKSDATLAALRTAVMALAYAAEKLPEVQKAYKDVSAAIESAVQQAAETVGSDCVRAALRTDWSEPKAAKAYQDWMRTGKAAKDPVQEHYNAFCAGWRMRARMTSAPRAHETAGWKLVPVEPTERMVGDGGCASCLPGLPCIGDTAARQAWGYMLAAAPQPTTPDEMVTTLRQMRSRSTQVYHDTDRGPVYARIDQLCAMLGLTDPSTLPDTVRKLKRAAELTADLDMVRYWAVDEHHARLRAAVEAAREAIK